MLPRWSPRTIELYRYQLDAHILPRVGHVPLIELAPLHVQEMVSSIVGAGHVPTANKCRRQLFTALKLAVRWELIPRNPVEAVDPVPEKRTELALWSPEQVKTFLTTHRGHRWFAAFYLLITSGLRRGELLGLRWEVVAEDGLYVRQTITVVNDVPTIGQPKTRRSSRFVALPPDTLAVLDEHRARQDATKALAGAWEHPELVFPSEIGTVMNPRNFYRSWQKAVTDAGLPPARIHDMRHLHVSLLILKGEDAKVISDRAGHSSTLFTLDRYGHVFNAQRKRAAHSLDDLLGATEGDPNDGRK